MQSKYTCKRKTEGELTYTEEEKNSVPIEATTGVMWPQTKDCQQPAEDARDDKWSLP